MDLVQVQTNAAVLMLDADFVPSADMYANIARGKSHPILQLRRKWANKKRQFIIMPAFERLAHKAEDPEPSCPEGSGCWVYRDVTVPLNKQALAGMLSSGLAEPFYWSRVRTTIPNGSSPGVHHATLPSIAVLVL